MGGMKDLFGDQPYQEAYARRTDPETSHKAAETVNVNKYEKLVQDYLLRVFPHAMTVIEIASAIDVHAWTISPRMKPLESKRLIERVGKKETINSNGKRSSQIAWRARR